MISGRRGVSLLKKRFRSARIFSCITPQSVRSSCARRFERPRHHLARRLQQVRAVFKRHEPAAHDLGQRFALAGVLVDGDDRQHEAVFGQMPAVANDDVLHHFVDGAGIDAHAADRDLLAFARAVADRLPASRPFPARRFLRDPRSRRCWASAGVPGQLPVFAVNRNEVARAHQVQHQLQLFGAAVAGNVHRRIHGAVDHVRAALGEVIDHADKCPSRCRE